MFFLDFVFTTGSLFGILSLLVALYCIIVIVKKL